MKRARFSRPARLAGLVLAVAACSAAAVCHALSCGTPYEVATLELIEVTEDGAAALDPPVGTQATLTSYLGFRSMDLQVSGGAGRAELYYAVP